MKVILCAVLAAVAATGSAAPAEVMVAGAWQVKIQTGNAWASLPVDKPEWHMKMEPIPYYVRPDWMGLTSEKAIDDDPRPYVKALRKFTAENHLALAEGSLRYGRLWRQGIPYSTLLMNNINHPNPYGMGLFADALMALFP